VTGRALLLPLALLVLLAAPAAAAQGAPASSPGPGQGPVVRLTIEGAITRATDLYLEEGLAHAQEVGASAVLLQLNTPGGGLEETFRMTDRIAASPIPVLGYVAPRTATAWSAGTVILLSTHVAAMAPFTVIGSSQPVALGEGGFTPINDTKIINAIVGKLRALALAHGRNATAAEEFVTKNLNLDASQALEAAVIEVVAVDAADLLRQADGRTALTGSGNATLRTAGKVIVDVSPSLRVSVLAVFFDPLIAGLLMLVGIYALVFGLGAPGMGAEVAGALAILLALVGLGFNVSIVGILLLLLGAGLLLFELHSPGFGAFGLTGLGALVLGTVFLAPLNPSGPGQWSFPAQYQQQVLLLLALPSVLFAGFLAFALVKVQQARRQKPYMAALEGREAVVSQAIAPGGAGFVTFEGEQWQAVSDWALAVGERVVVRSKDGPVLRVEPLTSRGVPPQAAP
jgi:membrane-bound serine protease (ClpP class)